MSMGQAEAGGAWRTRRLRRCGLLSWQGMHRAVTLLPAAATAEKTCQGSWYDRTFVNGEYASLPLASVHIQRPSQGAARIGDHKQDIRHGVTGKQVPDLDGVRPNSSVQPAPLPRRALIMPSGVTCSYLEGDQNELAVFEYSRYKKPSQAQLVIGLFTTADGEPLAVHAYEGNPSDPVTGATHVYTLQTRFGIAELVFAGARQGQLRSSCTSEKLKPTRCGAS